MPRAKQRTQQMRERVLATAVDMLASDGVAEFTTRRVAQQANTSTPAVYELFGDKAGLVAEMFFEGFRALGRRLNDLTPTTVDAKVLYFECPKSVGKFFGGQVGDVESRYPVREPQKKPTV